MHHHTVQVVQTSLLIAQVQSTKHGLAGPLLVANGDHMYTARHQVARHS